MADLLGASERASDDASAREDPLDRSNEEWIETMQGRGAQSAMALRALESYLKRTLGRMVGRRLTDEDLSDVVQEALARIVRSLASFRGDSAFTTWAAGIATRVAFTELRRREVRRDHATAFDVLRDEAREPESRLSPPPDETMAHGQLLSALHRAIASELTERQRVAVLCELRGLPTIEIAEKLGSNQNALYKLTHDARKKLRRALVAAGFTEESLVEGTWGIS